MPGDANVTVQFLLEGAAYSLEQAGFLLRDANRAFTAASYSTAFFLGALGRESLGQYIILKRFWRRVQAGEEISLPEIKNACQDHEEKQKAGVLSLTQIAEIGTGFGDLLHRRADADLYSEEYKLADRQLADITGRQFKRLPQDRHLWRMKALYVDPEDSGLRWNRPNAEISKQQAERFLREFRDDYANQVYNLESLAKEIEPELGAAWEAWESRPTMPPATGLPLQHDPRNGTPFHDESDTSLG